MHLWMPIERRRCVEWSKYVIWVYLKFCFTLRSHHKPNSREKICRHMYQSSFRGYSNKRIIFNAEHCAHVANGHKWFFFFFWKEDSEGVGCGQRRKHSKIQSHFLSFTFQKSNVCIVAWSLQIFDVHNNIKVANAKHTHTHMEWDEAHRKSRFELVLYVWQHANHSTSDHFA